MSPCLSQCWVLYERPGISPTLCNILFIYDCSSVNGELRYSWDLLKPLPFRSLSQQLLPLLDLTFALAFTVLSDFFLCNCMNKDAKMPDALLLVDAWLYLLLFKQYLRNLGNLWFPIKTFDTLLSKKKSIKYFIEGTV